MSSESHSVIQQRPLFALLLRLISTVIFAVMFMLIKYGAEQGLSVPEIMFWRQAMTAPAILLYLTATSGLHRLKTERLGSHAARGAVGMTNMSITFTATTLLPLAESTTLGFTTPIFAVILSALYFRQHVGKWRWTAVLLGFVGVVIIAQPGGHEVNWLGTALALTGGLIVAVINYQLRDLGRTEEPIRTVFYFGLFGVTVMSPALLFSDWGHSPLQWAIMIGLGFTGLFGQMLLAASLRHGAVVSVLVMDYATLIWAVGLGWLVWADLPTRAMWLGAPAIIGAGIIIAVREHRLHKALTVIREE